MTLWLMFKCTRRKTSRKYMMGQIYLVQQVSFNICIDIFHKSLYVKVQITHVKAISHHYHIPLSTSKTNLEYCFPHGPISSKRFYHNQVNTVNLDLHIKLIYIVNCYDKDLKPSLWLLMLGDRHFIHLQEKLQQVSDYPLWASWISNVCVTCASALVLTSRWSAITVPETFGTMT